MAIAAILYEAKKRADLKQVNISLFLQMCGLPDRPAGIDQIGLVIR